MSALEPKKLIFIGDVHNKDKYISVGVASLTDLPSNFVLLLELDNEKDVSLATVSGASASTTSYSLRKRTPQLKIDGGVDGIILSKKIDGDDDKALKKLIELASPNVYGIDSNKGTFSTARQMAIAKNIEHYVFKSQKTANYNYFVVIIGDAHLDKKEYGEKTLQKLLSSSGLKIMECRAGSDKLVQFVS